MRIGLEQEIVDRQVRDRAARQLAASGHRLPRLQNLTNPHAARARKWKRRPERFPVFTPARSSWPQDRTGRDRAMLDAGLYRRALPAHLRAQAADGIDFTALRGNTVGVLGAGASAFDNVAEALDAGANPLHLFCRRDLLQTIQPLRYITFYGFLRHLGDIDDERRWRFMEYVLGLRESFTQDAYDRCTSYPHFKIRTGNPWLDATVEEGRAVVTTPGGGYLICGTGGDMDVALRPELAAFSEHIATWADRYTPPQDEEGRLGRYPSIGSDYAFLEKMPGAARFLKYIHCFGIGACVSYGMSGAPINALYVAVPKLVAGVTRGLFAAKLEHHWEGLQAYDTSQVKLRN